MKNQIKIQKHEIKMKILWGIELALILFLGLFFSGFVMGGIGTNVNVTTYLQIGNVYPEFTNVSIENNAASISLVANNTKVVLCNAVVLDYNGDADIKSARAELFSISSSFYGESDDNNEHYTNDSCNITYAFGTWNGYADDEFNVLINCTFNVWYYAHAGNWNCSVLVNDTSDYAVLGQDNITFNQLLAVGLPNSIDYGLVNVTQVSEERIAEVINFGNVRLNLSLAGFARTFGDGMAMNCTQGLTKNISVMYEKYNLTVSNSTFPLDLSQFESVYVNLTSSPTPKKYGLYYRQNDTLNEAINSTYWRIYVPRGVAGNCTGKIVFGATTAGGT